MNSRRTIILFVAIAMAGLAAMGLLIYIRGIEDNVYAGRELVTVWVAEGNIPQGASGSDLEQRGLIVEKPIPAEFAPDAAIAVPGEEIVGLVAVNAIPAEQTIVKGMFAAPQVVATGVTDRLEERTVDEENARRQDMTTYTFSAGGTTAVAGLLEPGDFVNIMTRYAAPTVPIEAAEAAQGDGDGEDVAAGEETAPQGRMLQGVFKHDAAMVYQKAEILAIGTALPATVETAEGEEAAPAGGLITLAVPVEVAQIMHALDDFYLTLVSPDYEPWPVPQLDFDTFELPGEDCALLTPYGAPDPENEGDATVCERYADELQEALAVAARP
ncbi:MAG: hypothetical protein HKN24_12695 [Acidimicrobiales bacterium]|nr:hypothetical protein [Acidimicrobiales bacterium]